VIDDRLRNFDEFEIGRHGEQRRVRIISIDIRKLEGLLPHARIGSLAIDDSVEVGRSPDLGDDGDRLLVPDLARWNGVTRAHPGYKNTLHGLRAEVFRVAGGTFSKSRSRYQITDGLVPSGQRKKGSSRGESRRNRARRQAVPNSNLQNLGKTKPRCQTLLARGFLFLKLPYGELKLRITDARLKGEPQCGLRKIPLGGSIKCVFP
jgi:hypothetical protein